MTNYVAVDYGRVHLGLAIGEHMLATPLPAIQNDVMVMQNLDKVIKEYGCKELILGLPTGPLESEVRSFAQKLEKTLRISVILHDETLTTQDAQRYLVASGASRSKKQNEHSYAAALILEDYLDSATLG
jgi:putative holliday junction resolvase